MAVKIAVKGVSAWYDSIKALDGVTLELKEGEVASLIGPNGAGKTTLLRCVCNILKPKIGAVMIDGVEVDELTSRELAMKIGYVPQVQPSHLPLTVLEVVVLGRKPYVNWSLSNRDFEVAWRVLKMVNAEHLANRYFDELSGGERQKVFIARALAQEPEVLLLDEPTSNLDLKHQLEILSIIRSLAKERNLTVLMAMHDLNLACRFSDVLVMLCNGRIYAVGSPSEVITPDNIRKVYGVEAKILKTPHLTIVPLEVIS